MRNKTGAKRNLLLRFIFILSIYLMLSDSVEAADVYMSKTGTRTNGKSNQGLWTNSNCYNNLEAAFSAMQSGDTLTIDDGTYTGTVNAITQFNFPPSGTGVGTGDNKYTIIKARNIPCNNGVPCSQPLKVGFDSSSGAGFMVSNYPDNDPAKNVVYVKFHGIRWEGISAYTWDHIYYKQVASLGITDDNSATFGVAGQYNLLEDCLAFGKGRYKFLFYDYSRETQTRGDGNNICRRCIARNDFALKESDSQNPIASFSSYFNRGTAFLNSIDIDSDSPAFWKSNPGEISGAFYQPVDTGLHKMTVQGSIVINSALGLGLTQGTGNILTDIAGVHLGGGFNGKDGGNVNRLTMVDTGLDNFNYRNQTQINALIPGYFGINGYNAIVSITNSILRDITPSTYNILNGTTGSYLNTYLLGKAIGNTPTSSFTTDPYINGLLYPVRIESGSLLSSTGSGNGQIGARIINKLGKDGTFKGDADWNSEQESLWPWPMEAWVKAEMAAMPSTITGNTMPSATRGFATQTGKRLDGVNPVTLTSYIWESLGNQIPCSIYGTCDGNVAAPAAPGGLSVQ